MSLRPQLLYPWFTPVSSLKYIGPAMLQAFQRLLRPPRVTQPDALPAPVLRDLLLHLPTGTIDRRHVRPVASLSKGEYVMLSVTVDEHVPPPRGRKLPYRIATHDEAGDLLTLAFYNVKGDYLSRQLPVGEQRLVGGTVEMYHGLPTMAHPDTIAPISASAEILRLTPTYPLTYALSQRLLHRATLQALGRVADVPEWLDAAFIVQEKFIGFTASLKAIHQPDTDTALLPDQPYRRRLAYDELLANQLALALAKRFETRAASYAISPQPEIEARWRAVLPFSLTTGQENVLAEIRHDMADGQRMVRLLQGDVGSGKTILAFAAMAQVAANGLQACLMAPTDLLARQHLASLQPLAEAAGLRLMLLTGKQRKNESASVREAMARGDVDLVVGTHALFQDDSAFKKLGLIVVDEQHRFGVGQRLKLASKGQAPHLLQMTATPIPRSLGMTLYGDMDISSLTERPPGRKEIDTRAIPFSRTGEVIEGLARVMEAGEKAYWVCPLIDPPDPDNKNFATMQLAAAEERFAELNARFPGKVGLVHGRMKLPERERVMQNFAHGNLQLLVATTVIEVGVNVTTATVMVIEHAERFGLAQLHQLRGRVGRSDKASRCVLLYHTLGEIAKSRIGILRETNDGFRIAEEDLRLRGAGDLLGTRQTGLPEFLLVDYAHHLDLIRIAHDDVKLILHHDPDLTTPRGCALRLLLSLFDYDQSLMTLRDI
ncbi:MAG: ATP-dependent DNA helicase RecG [Rickettsiales bacterium]